MVTWRLLAGLLVLAIGACAIGKSQPSTDEMLRDVTALEATLPVIAGLGIEAYRNQDWCRTLHYGRGSFGTTTHESTCFPFEEQTVGFDGDADRDFETVRTSLAATGVPVRLLDAWHLGPNALEYVSFEVEPRAVGFQYWTYIYEPAYQLPAGVDSELEYTTINEDWYFVWEEWM